MDPYTWIYLIVAIVVSVALAPKPPKPRAASLEDFDLPTAEEGRPIPVVFGTVRITGPNILWYGDLGTKAMKKSSLFSKTTIGYKYYMGLHFGLCHGPVDAVTKIECGDKLAWSGNVTTNSSVTVHAPDLFGGKKREGGISGTFDVCMGGAAQTANTYLDSAIGYPLGGPAVLGDLPAFRGILGMVWRGGGSGGLLSFLRYDQGGYVGTTPYPKPWAFTVKRITSGWQGGTVWYSAKAAIGGAMNGAHIVYQTLTDPEWGMGLPADKLDEASFTTAADLLHAENFGLSLLWNQQATVEDFLTEVLNHIAGVLAFDRSSGKYRLTLLRGNYDANALPSYGPETLSAVTSFQRQAWGETVNELTLGYTDPTNLKSTSVTVHDIANVRAQAVRVATSITYPGIVSATIAQQVAMRELAARSTPLAKISFKVNRDLWQTKNADVVKINWPILGIENLVCRVLRVRQGTLGYGELEIDAVEDVFALSVATYTSQPSPDSGESGPGFDEEGQEEGPSVISATTTAPPGSPADGDSYLVPTGATGAWAGHEGETATWDADADAWIFSTPAPGTVVTVTTTGTQVQTVAGGTATSYTPIQSTGKVVFGTSITPPAIAADTNDYAPANLATASGMRLSASGAARNLTGLTGGEGGRLMLVHNVGSLDLVLKDESASSTAANRFALNADVTLKADQSTLLQYDGTSSRWRVIGGTGSGGGASVTTTKGDLIVRGASTDERLPVGAPGQWLTPDPTASGGVKWGNVAPAGAPNDGCAVRRTGAAQAIPSSTYTAIQFDTETRDDSGYWSIAQPTRLTAPRAGWYFVSSSIVWDGTTSGQFRILRVGVNGALNAHNAQRVPASGNATISVSETLYLNAGDYVEFFAYVDASGHSLYIPSDGNYPVASIHRLGTTVELGNNGGAEILSAAAQSIGHNVLPKTALTFDTVVRDDGGFANLGTNNSRLTIQSAGWYVVTGTVQWGAGGNGAYRVLEIWKNGSAAFLSNDSKPPATFAFMANVVAATHYFNAGDYVELRVYHDAGVSVSTSAGSARLAVMRVSAGPRRIIRGAQFVASNGLLSTSVNAVAVQFPRAATIRGVRMLVGENAGSVVVDIKKTTFASWGSGPGSSICASAKPTIVAGRTYSDDTLTGWTTAVAADDVLTFSLDSVSNLDAVSVQLTLDESQA